MLGWLDTILSSRYFWLSALKALFAVLSLWQTIENGGGFTNTLESRPAYIRGALRSHAGFVAF